MKIVDLISLDLDMGLAVIKGKSKKAGKILPVTLNLEDLEGYAFKCSVCGEIHPIQKYANTITSRYARPAKKTGLQLVKIAGS